MTKKFRESLRKFSSDPPLAIRKKLHQKSMMYLAVMYALIFTSYMSFMPVYSLKFRRFPSNRESFELLYRDDSITIDKTLDRAPYDILEESPISIRAVPSISEIERLARRTRQSDFSKLYSQSSGGYPDPSVKESVYLNLWACLTHEMKAMGMESSFVEAGPDYISLI